MRNNGLSVKDLIYISVLTVTGGCLIKALAEIAKADKQLRLANEGLKIAIEEVDKSKETEECYKEKLKGYEEFINADMGNDPNEEKGINTDYEITEDLYKNAIIMTKMIPYKKITLLYFHKDDIVIDENGHMMVPLPFPSLLRDMITNKKNVIFVRNEQWKTDYMVKKIDKTYDEYMKNREE